MNAKGPEGPARSTGTESVHQVADLRQFPDEPLLEDPTAVASAFLDALEEAAFDAELLCEALQDAAAIAAGKVIPDLTVGRASRAVEAVYSYRLTVLAEDVEDEPAPAEQILAARRWIAESPTWGRRQRRVPRRAPKMIRRLVQP
jgi:hypothetical protein